MHDETSLTYLLTTSLAVGTGVSIRVRAGNNATWSLPALTATGSLGISKAIVVNTSATKLALVTQPAGPLYRLTGWTGSFSGGMGTVPVIQIQDSNSTLVPINRSITVSIASGAGGTPIGTTAVNSGNRVARFGDPCLTG